MSDSGGGAFPAMNSMTDDVELLRRYAQDSAEDAFAELVRRHIDLVYAAALPRVGRDTHLAKDITQKVFIDLARRADSLAIRSSLAGWLYTRARFIATDVVRAEQRRRHREEQARLMNQLSAQEPSAADWNRLRPALEQAVDELKQDDRDAVLLSFFERRPFMDIGALLGLSEDAAQKRVGRSVEKLRASLAKRGVTSTAAALSVVLAHQPAVAAPAGLAASVTGAALASAPSAAAPAFSLIQLMSTTKLVSIAALALIIAALGLDTYEIRSSRATAAALSAANTNYEALLAQLHAAQEQARAAEQAARAQQAAAAAQAAAANAAASWDPVAAGKAFLARHPDVKESLIARNNAQTDLNYSRLYKDLGLTPAQIDQFRALMLEQEGTIGIAFNGSGELQLNSRDWNAARGGPG